MRYFILKHTDPERIKKEKEHPPWICRVEVPDHQANVLDDTFETFVSSGCYGRYKAYKMSKDDFDKGTLTPVHTLETLPKFIMDEVGYHPY